MTARRPNLVFLMTDDQRFDTIRALGNREIATPNLDRLVAEGAAFTQAHIMGSTNEAVCMPSRSMLMTGRTLFHLHGEGGDKGKVIPPEHPTLFETLRHAGYHTHHVGKWHMDRESFNRSFESAERIFGFTKNWYEFYGGHWNVAVHDYDPTGEYANETGYILAADKVTKLPVKTAAGGVHSCELFGDAAVSFIHNCGEDRPFALHVPFVSPHDPRQSPDEYEEMYQADAVALPPNYMSRHPFDNGEFTVRDERLEGWPRRKQAVREHIADYYAMITYTDDQVGRIMQALKDRGLYDNTIIVFTADHGLALGQHGLMGKQSLYEHSVRVPLLMRGPGAQAGRRIDALCYLIDIYPTLCDLTGLDAPSSVEGLSLAPLLEDKMEEVRDYLYGAYKKVQRSVKNRTYKLIRYTVKGEERTQLFRLDRDPWEIHNLADDPGYADVAADLLGRLEQWQRTADDPMLG